MKSRRWVKLLIRLVVLGLLLWFIHRSLTKAVADLRDYDWTTFSPYWPAWLAASGLLYAVGLLPMGLFWHRGLHAMGQRPRLGETLRAFYIGHLGKYVPGKALVVVLRTGLLAGPRTDARVAAASVFLETLTMMAVGASLAAASLAVWFREHTGLMLLAIGLMLGAGTPTLPPVFRRLVLLTGVGKRDPRIHEHLAGLTFPLMFGGWLAIAGGWVLLALSLWAVLMAMGIGGANPWPALPTYLGSVCLGTVAGFLSLIPGGAFVRESVMAVLLLPLLRLRSVALPEASAYAAAVLLRLVWLVTEGGISGILYFWGRRWRHEDEPPTA